MKLSLPKKLHMAAGVVVVATVPGALFLGRTRFDTSRCRPDLPSFWPAIVNRDWLGRLTLAAGFGLAALLVLLGVLLARRSRSLYPIMTLAVLLVGLGISLAMWATTKGYPCRGFDALPCRHIVLPLLIGAGSVATAFALALARISQRRRRFRRSGAVAAG
jgi:hypothetical protein